MPASLVTPVAKTGLHCGFSMVGGTMAYGTPVTPVAKTGLHCGRSDPFDAGDVAGVTPVAKTGLHCGRIDSHTDAV